MIMQLLWCVALMACECFSMNTTHGQNGQSYMMIQESTCTLNGALGILMHAIIECDNVTLRALQVANDDPLKNKILSLKQASTMFITNLMQFINTNNNMSEKLQQINTTLYNLYHTKDVMYNIITLISAEEEFLEIISHQECDTEYEDVKDTDAYECLLTQSGLFL